MYPSLDEVWGTFDPCQVFGGGPDEAEDFTEVKARSVTEDELEGLCF